MNKEQTITIDNVDYPISTLSDNTKMLLSNIQFIDNEIARLNNLIAVAKTARGTYSQALKSELLTPLKA